MNKKFQLSKFIIYIALIFWALTTIYPFILVIINSFKPSSEVISNSFGLPQNFTFANYENVFTETNILKAYSNSLIISGTTTICVVILASMASYAMIRFDFKLKKFVYTIMLGSLMIPAFSTVIPIFMAVANLGLINKHISVIIPQIAGNLSFATIVLIGFMSSLPLELEEAAFLEGCNIFGVFRRIILPLSIPAIVSVSIFTFLWSYNDLFLQMIMLRTSDVMPVSAILKEISSQFGTDFGLLASSVAVVVLPVLIVYIALQNYIIKGMTDGALKG